MNLPKGGGALHDIAESFTVSPLTGTAGFSIPIAATRGRDGFGPEPVLRYDSGHGNGVFGIGWQLSVPSISRKTATGLPRYRDTDVFVLTGAEDLVRWPTARRQTETHIVDRFRPRTERAFARIERWTRRADGDVHWRVTSTTNLVHVYGDSPSARIADPEDSTRVHAWLLERAEDDRGNIISYRYRAETTEGVDPSAPAERNRVGRPQPQRYLKRVRYGNRVPFVASADGDDWMFELVFDYDDHNITAPTPSADVVPWPVRRDPFSTCRPGFEVRTYRLCRRVLMFHRFAELGAGATLVRSTEFTYDERLTGARLTRLTQRGFVRNNDGTYVAQSLPPVEFVYTDPVLDAVVRALPGESLENAPAGLAEGNVHWLDLDGQGASAMVRTARHMWLCKRNLGEGQFGPAVVEPLQASVVAGAVTPSTFVDLEGDGRLDAVVWSPTPGCHAREPGKRWGVFHAFESVPAAALEDPHRRLVDVTGDGRADVIVTRGERISWCASMGRAGYSEPERFTMPADEERGPSGTRGHAGASVLFADMTGDGLSDLVRVSSGEIAYWPNLGYGRFGRKVTMADAPSWGDGRGFDARRLRFADLDGTGPADLVYVGDAGAELYFNHSGNSWSEAHVVAGVPARDALSTVQVVDLLATGTGCLVWSSSAPSAAAAPLRYVDLFGGVKPNLLARVSNGLGGEEVISYAPSTKFYLDDLRAGQPWVTRLPFPVQVVTKVESLDHVVGTRVVTTYRYRHGHFDGREREFRGFAYVEQRDAESLGDADDPLDVPPVVTRTWFHTGAWQGSDRIARQLAEEYWRGDPLAFALPDTTMPSGLDPAEQRDVCRALRGTMLRQEVYADDGLSVSSEPFLVVEHSVGVRMLQRRRGLSPSVVLPVEAERIASHYERDSSDPRVLHELTLDVDDWGSVRRAATVAYPRRSAVDEEQATALVTYEEHEVTHDVEPAERYRTSLPLETRAYQLQGMDIKPTTRARPTDILDFVDSASELDFVETAATGKRLLDHSRVIYWRDDLSGPLEFGNVGLRALPYQQYQLALTDELLEVFGDRVDPHALDEAGYTRTDAAGAPLPPGWWAPSGRVVPGAEQFFQTVEHVDPYGNRFHTTYDTHQLAVHVLTDPLGNVTTIETDYRTLQPRWIEDPNANRSAVTLDAWGAVVASFELGKDPAIDPAQRGDIDEPTTTFEYDLAAWRDRGEPIRTHIRTRERHGDPDTPWQEQIVFLDGRGRPTLTKSGAEPASDGSPRWIGTGRVVLNNKELPVKEFEPYFSTSPDYDSSAEMREQGVTSVVSYDALGRATRVDFPDGTFSSVEWTPWRQRSYDRNDTVSESQWFAVRATSGGAEQRAAELAAEHDGTPTVVDLDVLGRVYRTVEDNGAEGQYETRTMLSIEGNALGLTDARGNLVQRTVFDLLDVPIASESSDGGRRWNLGRASGNTIRSWDERGHRARVVYDVLSRPTHMWIESEDRAWLAERNVYGEPALGDLVADQEAKKRGLRGQLLRHWHPAGVTEASRYDFKGNLAEGRRRLARELDTSPDWSVLSHATSENDLELAQQLLESEWFTERTVFDALDRVVQQTLPDGTELRPRYNERSLLRVLTGRMHGRADSDEFVANVEYDAKGRRTSIRHGNGIETRYHYDPQTLRLTRLHARRTSDGKTLQDYRYTHDPVGNVVDIVDESQPIVFHNGQQVEARRQFRYDAVYRLIEATGREHESSTQPGPADATLGAHPNDLEKLQRYVERYTYDSVGNLLQIKHQAGAGGSWRRSYEYEGSRNRLIASSAPGDPDGGPLSSVYAHDAHGNITAMPHLPSLVWTHADQLQAADLGGGGEVRFAYEGSGDRVRKLRRHAGALIEERIYLGSLEIYRRRRGSVVELERNTVHVSDGTTPVAMVELVVQATDPAHVVGASRARYQLPDQLGSSMLEVDHAGKIIGWEEYHPFGTSALRARSGTAEVSAKRFRYAGKERDEETGLYYFGARYYCAWLGRWMSLDPAGAVDGPNRYQYSRSNPVTFTDRSGLATGVEELVLGGGLVIELPAVATIGAVVIIFGGLLGLLPDPPPPPPHVVEAMRQHSKCLSRCHASSGAGSTLLATGALTLTGTTILGVAATTPKDPKWNDEEAEILRRYVLAESARELTTRGAEWAARNDPWAQVFVTWMSFLTGSPKSRPGGKRTRGGGGGGTHRKPPHRKDRRLRHGNRKRNSLGDNKKELKAKRRVWKKKWSWRGNHIEKQLSKSEYKGWAHVGKQHNGFFPLIDFADEELGRAVSLKTTKSKGSVSWLRDHINDLGKRRPTFGETKTPFPHVELDIRVPNAELADYLRKELAQTARDAKVELRVTVWPKK